MKTFTQLKNLFGSLSQNTSTTNLTLGGQLINDGHRYLLQKYFDNERSMTALTVASQQFYTIASNLSKVKDVTITVGQLKFSPIEIMTRSEWDRINFLPYTSDIPAYYFIYNGQVGFFPIPATAGNTITLNYKTRVADLTYSDYGLLGDGTSVAGSGTLATMTVGSTIVTGTGTAWLTTGGFPQTADLTFQNLMLRADPATGGDGIWYQINSFQSATSLTLNNPVMNVPAISATTKYTIGQMPLLSEDFHDMLVYYALKIYFSSIVNDPNKFKEFNALYLERLELLAEYAGTKAINVDLGEEPQNLNPNLFLYA